ncbi:MAG: hypothetical protein ACT4OY_07520 [Alphaproteobacteria bacterium]
MKSRIFQLPERGSALIIVLVAVALFAALSFTVTQMLREGNPKAIVQEKSRLYAQEVLTYANAIREAAREVRISSGCSDTDISFESASAIGYAHVPPARDECKIYDAGGGAMTFAPPSEDWLDGQQAGETLYGKIYVAGNVCVPGIGTGDTDACDGDGEDNEDLVLFIPYIRGDVCMALNTLIGVTEDDDVPPVETGDGWAGGAPLFTGAFSDGTSLDQDGRTSGCFEGSGVNDPPDNSYHFFLVLSPR